jgi:hypothetical protein
MKRHIPEAVWDSRICAGAMPDSQRYERVHHGIPRCWDALMGIPFSGRQLQNHPKRGAHQPWVWVLIQVAAYVLMCLCPNGAIFAV